MDERGMMMRWTFNDKHPQPFTQGDTMIHILIFIAMTLLLTACGTERKQETTQGESGHKHDSLTEQASIEGKVAKAKSLIQEAKRELRLKEEYSCCIETECNTCLLEHLRCSCYDSVKQNKPVCNECYAGWQRGDGADPDIDKRQVSTTYVRHDHSSHTH